jgi:PAS domain S-box-containing protein
MDETVASLGILDKSFGGISVVFYTAAASGCFELSYVSANILRVLGVSPETCVGNSGFWQERIHADDLESVLRVFARLDEGLQATLEFRFRDDQSHCRWLSNEVAFRQDNEKVYLAGCLRDISAEKYSAAEYDSSLKEMGELEYFYRSMLDSVPQRLFWKDRNSIFRGCNLNGARALKLTDTGQIVGKTDYDFYANPDEAAYLQLEDEQVMNQGQASYHAEVPARQGDTWLDVAKVPLRNAQGEVCGLLISYADVSALKKNEMALHKFKRAVEQSSNCIFIADAKGDIEYVNPAFLGAYGYAEHEVMGRNIRTLKTGIIWQEAYGEMWQAVLGGNKWSGELSNLTKSGQISWHSSTFSPIFDEGGKVAYLLAIENNITERKQMEVALAENEARLREIASTVGEGIFVVDTLGIITFVNPAAARQLGWNVKGLLGKNAHHTFNCPGPGVKRGSTHDTGKENRWLDKIKYQRKAMRSESQFFKHKDGSRFQVSIIATPIFREAQFAGAVVAFHDITEQKFTQQLLNDTLKELRTVLDNAQIGVAYVRKNEFSWINKHMESMFGFSGGELLGKPMETIYAMEENELDGLAGRIYRLLATGGVYESEWPMKKSTGETFWCHQRGVAIDSRDLSKGSIWIMLDIDRLKNTEHTLKAMNGALTQRVDDETRKSLEKERMLIQQGRNAAMGEMIGNIAHQWRQPLSTLGLVVQNIYADFQESTLSESALKKYVETAKQAIQRMSSTIDDFRDFFRPNRVKEYFSIYQSIDGAIQLLDAMLKSNEITVQLTGSKALKTMGRPNEFSQVILNFMTNAKDSLVERGIAQGCISIELAERDGWGVVTIRDNAGGIQSENLEKIFDPYFTTKANGTGIGLYINKTIVEKHMNGRILCRNLPEGAEFTITVPLQSDDSALGEVKND